MNILIAGGSGLIGQSLIDVLQHSHQLTFIGRNTHHLLKLFKHLGPCHDWHGLDDIQSSPDLIINLCGLNIGDAAWTPKIKQELIDSRVKTSEKLIQWAIKQQIKPRMMCANAVGIYGLQNNGDEAVFTEDSPIKTKNPTDFLNEIGVRWEEALRPAMEYGMPVVTTRFGVVLKKNQGILKKLNLSFYLGLGSIIGDGTQMFSWVHHKDMVRAIIFLIEHPDLTGPFNITSPHPVTQKTFAKALANSMHRPLLLTLPAVVVKLMFGEMGECLLLRGQKVIPKRLLDAGFVFDYPTIEQALSSI